MKKIPLILNALLASFAIGIVSMMIARYYLERTPSIAIGAVLGAGTFLIIVAAGFTRKRERAARSARERSVRAATLAMHPTRRKEFLKELLSLDYPVSATDDGVEIVRDGEPVRIVDRLRYATLGGDDVTDLHFRHAPVSLVILCDGYDKTAAEAAAVFKVKLLPWREVMALFDRARAYPPPLRNEPKKPKAKAKRLLAAAFHPRRGKAYLLTALVLATTAFVSPYRLYYLIFAAVCCALAAASFCDPARQRETSRSPL